MSETEIIKNCVPEDIPEYVIKTSAAGCCRWLVPCGAAEKDGKLVLCPDTDGLIPLAGTVTEDKSKAMSLAFSIGSALIKVCEAAARCNDWFIPDKYLDLSMNGLFYDPVSGCVKILPGICGTGESFGRRICRLAEELAADTAREEGGHLVKRLCESGASRSDDKKLISRHITQILLK